MNRPQLSAFIKEKMLHWEREDEQQDLAIKEQPIEDYLADQLLLMWDREQDRR